MMPSGIDCGKRMPLSSGPVPACPPRQATPTPANGLPGILQIFRKNTGSRICTPAASIPTRHRRNPGPSGAVMCGSTGSSPRRNPFMNSFCNWSEAKIILSSPPTWITASSGRALTKNGFSTPRGITACSSAAPPAARKLLTTKHRSAGWWKPRAM